MPLYPLFTLCLVCCVSRLVSGLVSYTSLISSLAFACLVCCVSRLVFGLVFCTFLALSLALCLLRYVSRLVSRPLGFCFRLSVVDLLVFLLYIISLDKQSYVELVVNQYRCLVWRCQVSCALHLLRLLPRLLPCLLLGFRSCCGVVDLLGFLSIL